MSSAHEGTRVLVVEDERAIADFVRLGLTHQGYTVQVVADGNEGLRHFRTFAPHLVVLDLMLPGMDGLTLCRRLREISTVPILVVTARDDVSDRVHGLDSGADDYLTKPFDFAELSARVRALLRRAQGPTADVLRVGELTLDPESREVTVDEQVITLTAREFDLLHYLMRYSGRVLTREAILHAVWGPGFVGDDNIIEVYIRYLRDKLGDRPPRYIQTMRGVGYVLKG
ncbi:MAG: response regulator transcription factor [Chloroflexota bacterium]|jgi:DNA-binding response OmpR family regulator|nr:response regulator transcription factor [Chloroflexota bacterium]